MPAAAAGSRKPVWRLTCTSRRPGMDFMRWETWFQTFTRSRSQPVMPLLRPLTFIIRCRAICV